MTTRETVAAMALQGILAGRPDGSSCSRDRFGIVNRAVASADALLAELKRTQPQEVSHERKSK